MNAEQSAPAWPRIAEIQIENYKSIESLRIELPRPSTPDELDAFVLGSQNGIGKSSVLECCALGLIGSAFPKAIERSFDRAELDSYDLLIRAGTKSAEVRLRLQAHEQDVPIGISLQPGGVKPIGKPVEASLFERHELSDFDFEEGGLLATLLGMTSEPLLLPPLLLFHSYRKVVEGSSALGVMLDYGGRENRRFLARKYGRGRGLAAFKVALVQALMARSGMFEGVAAKGDSEQALEQLNSLIRDFAGGRVDKLKPGPDGALELRVSPVSGGASYSFDGLSSGQKEMIATLFLIWNSTQHRPSVVLIDEPELHLNAEWQRLFVRKLAELSPQNQYILATHSEEIFASVPAERRLMLRSTPASPASR